MHLEFILTFIFVVIFTSKSETLLDVDVDFLYFMSAGESLVRANVSHDVIDDLNSNLCRLLCPSSGDQETAMDRFISEFRVTNLNINLCLTLRNCTKTE